MRSLYNTLGTSRSPIISLHACVLRIGHKEKSELWGCLFLRRNWGSWIVKKITPFQNFNLSTNSFFGKFRSYYLVGRLFRPCVKRLGHWQTLIKINKNVEGSFMSSRGVCATRHSLPGLQQQMWNTQNPNPPFPSNHHPAPYTHTWAFRMCLHISISRDKTSLGPFSRQTEPNNEFMLAERWWPWRLLYQHPLSSMLALLPSLQRRSETTWLKRWEY